jgi:hypothetical protein
MRRPAVPVYPRVKPAPKAKTYKQAPPQYGEPVPAIERIPET